MLNQENKADTGKHDPTLLMHDLGKALKAVTAVLNYGAEKYEPRGWKTVEPRSIPAATPYRECREEFENTARFLYVQEASAES